MLIRTPRISPKTLGTLALIIAGAMLLTELLWLPIFSIPMGTWRFPVYVLVAIYGGLQLYLWYATTAKLPLTAEEVAAWGPRLEEATPLIVELFSQGKHSREIAAAVETRHQIPPEITLRYIIELARHLRGSDEAVEP